MLVEFSHYIIFFKYMNIKSYKIIDLNYQLLKMDNIYPNVYKLFRKYLSLIISHCSGERSYSKIKLIF